MQSPAPLGGSGGGRAKAPPNLHSPDFFGCQCQSHIPSLGLAENGSNPLQHVISISRHLLRVSQTQFGAGQREKKTETCSSHTPYSFLIAFLVTHIHGKGATRHQCYWPCAKCCKISSMRVRVTLLFKNSWRTRPSCYLQARGRLTLLTYAHLMPQSKGESSGMHTKEGDHRDLSSHHHSSLCRTTAHLEPGSRWEPSMGHTKLCTRKPGPRTPFAKRLKPDAFSTGNIQSPYTLGLNSPSCSSLQFSFLILSGYSFLTLFSHPCYFLAALKFHSLFQVTRAEFKTSATPPCSLADIN